jgi:hypothetical protein
VPNEYEVFYYFLGDCAEKVLPLLQPGVKRYASIRESVPSCEVGWNPLQTKR